ncbi:MAG: glycosyltransferase [Nitrospirae bacterium]|nr:glycosyltransferase [Nitrospirota bacterium]
MASVVILTKNGIRHIGEVLEGISSQPLGCEVIAVDSGSTDGTLDVLAAHGVKVVKIRPEEFDHGLTRNLGAENASPGSRYIVFLTQDAVPEEGWLEGLIRPMEEDPEVAGVFSRQVPRQGGSPIVRRYMTEVWEQCGGPERVVKKITDPDDYRRRTKWYVTFADPSSAVRREVFERIPFRRADFAEDVMWARDVLDAGYKLVYEPASRVVHSHDYTLVEQLRQNFDDASALSGITGAGSGKGRPLMRLPGKLWRDAVYIWRGGGTLYYRLRWALYVPLWHFATLSGTFLGMKKDRLPGWLAGLFSRQAGIKKGRRAGKV